MNPLPDMTGIDAVVFDFDGTLYNNASLPLRMAVSHLSSLRLMLAERQARRHLMGLRMEEEEQYYAKLFAAMARSVHRPPQQVATWYHSTYMPALQRMLRRHYRPYPWVLPLLAQLRQDGVHTAVLSDYGCLPQRMAAIGIDPHAVDVLADAPSLGGGKPCAESGQQICSLLHTLPERTLMIGDRDDTDGEMARRSGMRFHRVRKQT